MGRVALGKGLPIGDTPGTVSGLFPSPLGLLTGTVSGLFPRTVGLSGTVSGLFPRTVGLFGTVGGLFPRAVGLLGWLVPGFVLVCAVRNDNATRHVATMAKYLISFIKTPFRFPLLCADGDAA